ncbi:MAG TPA: hypothetical protein VF755_06765 [Catenuloplanes sp.]|jgi:hypothetical protein
MSPARRRTADVIGPRGCIQNGYCRLCWHQAALDGNAAGRRRGADAAYLHGQLDLAPIRHFEWGSGNH